jgi:hypothetical protein
MALAAIDARRIVPVQLNFQLDAGLNLGLNNRTPAASSQSVFHERF